MTLRHYRFIPTAPWYVRLVEALVTGLLNGRARWHERQRSEQPVVVDVEARGWVEKRKDAV